MCWAVVLNKEHVKKLKLWKLAWERHAIESMWLTSMLSCVACVGEGDESRVDLLLPYQKLPYACLLPRAQVLSTWAKARTLEQLACDLMKILFSTEERILCNVNGKMGKRQFNVHKIQLIREVLHFFSSLPPAEFEEQWKSCVTKIDTANRGLKRNLVLRGRKATCLL